MGESKGGKFLVLFILLVVNIFAVSYTLIADGVNLITNIGTIVEVNLIGVPVMYVLLFTLAIVVMELVDVLDYKRASRVIQELEKDEYSVLVSRVGNRKLEGRRWGEAEEMPEIMDVLNYQFFGAEKPKELDRFTKGKLKSYIRRVVVGAIDNIPNEVVIKSKKR